MTFLLHLIFFLIEILSMESWWATARHGVTRKRSTKRLKHTGNLFRKNPHLKDVCSGFNSWIKATKIIGQRKPFCKQRILESSCARKGTADIDILVTSRNSDTKIMQSIWITSRLTSKIRKLNQLNQFRWTYTKAIPIEKP